MKIYATHEEFGGILTIELRGNYSNISIEDTDGYYSEIYLNLYEVIRLHKLLEIDRLENAYKD